MAGLHGGDVTPMYCLPADDAPLREWLRPVSALFTPRRLSYFSDDDMAAERGTQGAMTQRMNKMRRKRAAKIDMRQFLHLHDQGMAVAEMAVALGVSTRSVERAMTMRPRDG